MIVKCTICSKDFNTEPKLTTFCGTEVASESSYPTATIDTTCRDCTKEENN
ncbi:hypothetical protein [Clostridium formicaceticum]|uniref:Uncharacterized protein n=1 Tax=Clostridium formicaceticum TaxID=1497 RepID=A0AAC9RL02_9CLOT|nr:hypothetical protein [Clostridium formicaceticum]ARE87243.1 hypothetical protein CLFO_16420 [Clostridium formicaceticum]